MEQPLGIGENEKAISIFVDKDHRIHWLKYPSLTFDGHDPDGRAVILFPGNLKYDH